MFLINQQFTGPGEKAESFPSPSAERAYDFTVAVFYRRAGAGRRHTSAWLDERERREVSGTVRETARQVSHGISVLEPVRAEQAINAELERRFTAAESRWSARVEVSVPADVQTMLREALRREHDIDARARENERRLDKADRLRRRWAEFLNDAAKDPTAPHALELAERADIADVLRRKVEERHTNVDEWFDLIARIVEAHQNAGILDLVLESDSILRRTLEMMGIEYPAPPEEPLVLPEGEGR